jgi:2'-5' RNA ligase
MRLFIGISIGEQARTVLARAAAEMRKIADGRYVTRDMYHITLAFLGELEAGQTGAVQAAMDEAACRARPVPLALADAGTFGKAGSEILYAGVRGADGLRPLADRLRGTLTTRGLPFDPKPFQAHITLARRVNATRELLASKIEPVAFYADGLTLFHSCRVDGVLRYLPIYESHFEKGDL